MGGAGVQISGVGVCPAMRLLSTSPSPSQLALGLLFVRLALGAVFIAHGAQKLFVSGVAGVAQGFGSMGIPAPSLVAPLVAAVEFFGGIALVLGLLTRLASLALAIDMLCAMLLVHLKNGFFLPRGFEFVLVLLGGTLLLLLAGPGLYSLDHLMGGRRAPRSP